MFVDQYNNYGAYANEHEVKLARGTNLSGLKRLKVVILDT